MISVLLVGEAIAPGSGIANDLGNAGFHLVGASDWRNLVRHALQLQPALVVADAPRLDDQMIVCLETLFAAQPLPVLLFTGSTEAQRIEQALDAGVSAYVVDAYAPHRLRPLAQLAIARFRREQTLRSQVADLQRRFDERKLIDRAKSVLMRARQIHEDEAFRMLQVASMRSNSRVGQVSQQVIDAARYAEAVNRSGQLRMLSQQMVKHAAMRELAADPAADTVRLEELRKRGRANLQALRRGLEEARFGDLLDAVAEPWQRLEKSLEQRSVQALSAVDSLAEQVLQQAERLTTQIENARLAAPLRVINLSGRQRMLSQRLAKQALLSRLLEPALASAAVKGAAETAAAFEQALGELDTIPLSSEEIRTDLARARRLWSDMLTAVAQVAAGGAAEDLRGTSEALLELFERLTGSYEHSMQMLLG